MARVRADNFQLAADEVNRRQQINKTVTAEAPGIRALYKRLGLKVPGNRIIERMALGTTSEFKELQRISAASQWVDAFEGFHGRKIAPKFKEGVLGSKKAATLAFVDKLMANFPQGINQYKSVLAARQTVGAEDQDLVSRFGRQRLINANLGIGKDAALNLSKFSFLTGLNPVIKQQFNREATIADVERIQDRFGTVARFGEFLGAGQQAERALAAIKLEDIGDFGIGDVTQEGLQQDIFASGGQISGNLQARIEEARKRREALFTPGRSVIPTSLTGGQLTQDLF